MELVSLGSGSSGNAFLVSGERASILIDCGVAVRACTQALRSLPPHQPLAAILISHEHGDHVRSLASVARRVDCPVVTTRGTRRALRLDSSWHEIAPGQRYATSGIEVTFISVAHDAEEPCGFVVECDGQRAAIFTDLGHVTPQVLDALAGADTVVLEANYDAGMLRRGRYPQHLKRRISGSHGHLSNDDCAAALVAAGTSASSVWLAHLSENNNHPQLAQATVNEALGLAGSSVSATPLPRFATQNLAAPATPPARQLRLAN